jgi:hypothetical protein
VAELSKGRPIQEAAEQMAHEELTTIQQGEDLNVEDIPF